MNLGQPPFSTMTSREIAELTGKRRDNVRRDTTNMLEPLGLAAKGHSGWACFLPPLQLSNKWNDCYVFKSMKC